MIIVKKIEKRDALFYISFSCYKVYAVYPTQIVSRDQKMFTGSGIKIYNNFGNRDQNLRPNCRPLTGP